MLTSDKVIVQLIVDQCEKHGIKHIVFSPGSRNAPLAIAFDEHNSFITHVIHDERSAAFFALGLAQELKEAVAICCTSGSAVLNYYPAIAEAYYRSIPLLILSADRPPHLINQGDGQTIVQKDVYKNHVHESLNLNDQLVSESEIWEIQTQTSKALNRLSSAWKGPVHINIGLDEPLYNTVEKTKNYARTISEIENDKQLSPDFCDEAREILPRSKVLVLCGQMENNERLLRELVLFSDNTNVLVLVENTANLQDQQFIHCIDRSLNQFDHNKEEYHPDVLITIGGAVVSKKIKTFLRNSKPKHHWRIGADFPEMNTYSCLSCSLEMTPEKFFQELNQLKIEVNKLNYSGLWKKQDILAKDKIPAVIKELKSLSDLVIFYNLFDYLPDNCVLHMANSSVVRYCQLFDPIKTVRYESNRGTSGIDGSTSTAIGAAIANPSKMHFFISGETSFIYDSNALWIRPFPKNLKIIVVNNSGGGIFKIIAGPAESKQGTRYFEAQHSQKVSTIAEAFGLTTKTISNKDELMNILPEFLKDEIQVLEIHTNSEQNPIDLNYFFNALKQ